MKTLTVIIVTYNSEKDIYDCLASVFKHNDLGDALEVIVVDNHSTEFDKMRKQIGELFHDKVIICTNEHNGGYGQGNNIGIRMAQAPYIAIMNPDIRLITPIFSSLVHELEQPNIAMCAGKQLDSKQRPFTSFYSLLHLPWWISRPLEFLSHHGLDHYFYHLQYLSGAFFAIRKDIFEQIGLFDEKLFMYAEEQDIHQRLTHTFPHMRAIYLKNKPYLHLAEKRAFSSQRTQLVYQSNGYVLSKNGYFAINYWKGQIRLNNMLSIWYFLFHHKHWHIHSPNIKESNTILQRLIMTNLPNKIA